MVSGFSPTAPVAVASETGVGLKPNLQEKGTALTASCCALPLFLGPRYSLLATQSRNLLRSSAIGIDAGCG